MAVAAAPLLATPRPRKLRATLAVAALAITLAASGAATHIRHYAVRADGNGRGLLAEIAAAPVCTGAPPVKTAHVNTGDLQP